MRGLVRPRTAGRGARALLVGAALATLASAEEPAADAAPGSFSPRALVGARLEDLAFLAGVWYAGEDGDASWQMVSCPTGDRMLGLQEDVAGGRSRFFEFQVYARRGEHVVFLASPLGRPPTAFVAVEIAGTRAVFENVHHDFPQRIVMTAVGDELVGRIEGVESGEERSSEWRWRRTAGSGDLLPHCSSPTDEADREPLAESPAVDVLPLRGSGEHRWIDSAAIKLVCVLPTRTHEGGA